MQTSQENVDVLVVGAGPVGTTLALELARQGVGCRLIDRHRQPSPHPKMDYLNARSMELLRRLDVVDEIRRRGIGAEHSFNFLWARSLAEAPLAEWSSASVAEVERRIATVNDGTSPLEPYQRLPGNVLEEILRERAAVTEGVDLRLGTEFVELISNTPDGVVALVRDSATGADQRIAARHLVACDGAGSAVRAAAGIRAVESGPVGEFRDVYFRSGDPALRKHGRFFLMVLASGITLVSRDEHQVWTGFFPLFDESEAEMDPAELMCQRLGTQIAVDEVLNVARWRGAMAVAEAYRSGSVFLAGDAAHQFYPTGGHGANTGLGDAVDLAWKLAAAVRGWAGSGLLDSYHAERRPVALFNREMCFNLLEVWQRFPQLAADGASREHLAGYLEQDAYQVENTGIHLDYRYLDSPITWAEPGDPPPWRWKAITPSTRPGHRVPSVLLDDGGALFDRFGTGFTLVDFSGAGDGVVAAAARRGMPVEHLRLHDPAARAVWGHDLVLVRPDQHAAWRGTAAPQDWGVVLDRVRGR
ncbi:FAD-dependent monooxygenase [Micromonospora sp. NPDC005215]|uniref:FAD-dependent monooxygenase n=1 Tax=Micromonospora sp. NPDC005215 TaxID=3157024 RepID=UPI0033AB6866